MKTLEEYQKFADELALLCDKHGIGIVGTCGSEGIYGEITLFDFNDPDRAYWIQIENAITFIVDHNDYNKQYVLDNEAAYHVTKK